MTINENQFRKYASFDEEISIVIKKLEKFEIIFQEVQKIANIGFWEMEYSKEEVQISDGLIKIYEFDTKNEINSKFLILEMINMVHPDDRQRVVNNFNYSINNKMKCCDREYRLVLKRNTQKNIFERIITQYNGNGIPIKSIGIVVDCSLRKFSNEKEIDKFKDGLIALIVHDLRNPFAAIFSSCELLIRLKDKLNSDDIMYYLNAIYNTATESYKFLESIMHCLDTMKSFSEFQPTKFNLKLCIDKAMKLVDLQAKNKKINIQNNVKNDIEIFAIEELFCSIIRNLLSNAIKFTFTGGNVLLDSYLKNDEIVIFVSDTGRGMSKAQMIKLFTQFSSYSTNGTEGESGTGLGLILCKEFVEKHGGKIWVESEEGKGSTFYVSIPTMK